METTRAQRHGGMFKKLHTALKRHGHTRSDGEQPVGESVPAAIGCHDVSLWDHAYSALREKDPKLIEEYEAFLFKESCKTSTALGINGATGGADKESRRAQLEEITKQGLQRMDDKKMRYTIGDKEFCLQDQVSQETELVIWAKDFIGAAVKNSPEASMA